MIPAASQFLRIAFSKVNVDAPWDLVDIKNMVRWSRTRVALVCLAGLLVNLLIFGPSLRLTAHGITDFMDLYAGGKLAFTPHLYSPVHVLKVEQASAGQSSDTRLYMRLPVFALFYWPLAQLSYQTASAIWELLCVLSLAGFVLFWPARHRRYAFIACCWSMPVVFIVAEGQDVGFVLMWIAIASWLMRRKRPIEAGLAASLCLVKFHLFLMIPIWICARKQWKFASGLLAGCAALFILSFAPGGMDWPAKYLDLVTRPGVTPWAAAMPTIYGVFSGMPHAIIPEIAITLLIALGVWTASRANVAWGLSAALAGSVLAAPHAYLADAALLVPAVLLVFRRVRHPLSRALLYLLASPAPWVLLMGGSPSASRLGLAAFVAALALTPYLHRRPISKTSMLQPLAPASQG